MLSSVAGFSFFSQFGKFICTVRPRDKAGSLENNSKCIASSSTFETDRDGLTAWCLKEVKGLLVIRTPEEIWVRHCYLLS